MSKVNITVDGILHTVDKEDFFVLMSGANDFYNKKFYQDMKKESPKVNEMLEEDNRLADLADKLMNVVSESLRDRYY